MQRDYEFVSAADIAKQITSENLNWEDKLTSLLVTDELMDGVEKAECCWHSILTRGHMTVICAKANGGKTTIMIQAAADMSKQNFKVIYMNLDAGSGQLVEYHAHAKENGYNLISPDLVVGKSVNDAIDIMKAMANSESSLDGIAIFLDTLKKFTDMINKSKAKEFYSLLRKLTVKGATIIALAHANKYEDEDGMPIFEGTGDLRNDFDDLIYLIPAKKEHDGSMVVSAKIDKNRNIKLQDMSFRIAANRSVSILDGYVDVVSQNLNDRKLEKDSPIIEFISNATNNTTKSVLQLWKESEELNLGYARRAIENICYQYSTNHDGCAQPLWRAIKAPRGGFVYQAIDRESETMH